LGRRAFDELRPKDTKIGVLSNSHEWSRRPVRVKKRNYLIFSDIPRNHILKWKEDEGVDVFVERSWYSGNGHQEVWHDVKLCVTSIMSKNPGTCQATDKAAEPGSRSHSPADLLFLLVGLRRRLSKRLYLILR
jgi:sugar lactone lactonase YvrE